MSEEKDNLKSIKVYKFNNTKENWHEFALKFRVIADSRGYYGGVDGSMSPPDEQETITVTTEDKGDVLNDYRIFRSPAPTTFLHPPTPFLYICVSCAHILSNLKARLTLRQSSSCASY